MDSQSENYFYNTQRFFLTVDICNDVTKAMVDKIAA